MSDKKKAVASNPLVTRDVSHYSAKCRRCRHAWEELHGTRHTEGIGALRFCPRCLSQAINREPVA